VRTAWPIVCQTPFLKMTPTRLVLCLLCLAGMMRPAFAATNGAVLPAVKVPRAGLEVPLAKFLPPTAFAGQAVRVLSSEGPFNLQLLPVDAPATVTNFLRYVDADAYRNLVVHRSDPDFVIQTGGFTIPLAEVPEFPPVTNEFRLSNLRGTVAMAKLGGFPNSATSQWFINLRDNTGLDTNNGGFTVFARVTGSGMSNVDRIAALPVYNATNIGPAFGELPLKNYNTNNQIFISNLVMITNVVHLPAALSSDPSAFTAEIAGEKLRIKFRGFPSNPVTVSYHSHDSSTNPWFVSLPVRPPAQKFAGLLARSNGTAPTLATLSVTPAGVFSGGLVHRSGRASFGSSSLRSKFNFADPGSGVLFRSLGESLVYWYGHEDGAFFALAYTNAGFSNTLTGALMPHAYSGATNDTCPLASKLVNALLTRTNQLPPPLSGFLQFAFDKSGGAKITGALPDNRSVSGASSIVREPWSGRTLLPIALFTGKGQSVSSLTGTLEVSPTGTSGALQWVVGTNAPTILDVRSTVWTNLPGTNALSHSTNSVSGILKIPGLPDLNLLWGPENKPRFEPTNGMTFRLDRKTGAFSGVATRLADNGKKSRITYRGVIYSSVPAGTESGLRGSGFAREGTNNSSLVVRFMYP
jgi:peptidyl-prolyl cis-trans isomerase A (cyclophilin A)